MIFIKQKTDSKKIINLHYVIDIAIPINTIPNASLEIRFRMLHDGDVVFHYNSEEERKVDLLKLNAIIEQNRFGIYELQP